MKLGRSCIVGKHHGGISTHYGTLQSAFEIGKVL